MPSKTQKKSAKNSKKKLPILLNFLGVFDIYKCEGMRTAEMRKR